ncbi:MAG: IS1182 family transposase [Candidatus Hadarchaeum sp.]|uniref:IS1182 family transposase n=1 Tax=Candidatus Hadarchaeum sp. TaxID=2883567 RepID=UPI003D1291C5
MNKTYRDYHPDQLYILPPSPRDWLPENHLAHFISDVVDDLDISVIEKSYEKELRGYPPYHPRMMLKILIYAYTTGVFSSRKIERKIQEDIAFRYLSAGNMPNFRTISDFRKRHLSAFKELFLQVLKIAEEAGLIKLGHIALDGTKVKANASKHKAMSYGRMKKREEELEQEIKELLAEAEKIDQEENHKFGKDKRGDELPSELARRETRLAKIRQAKEAIERRAREEKEAQNKGTKKDDGSASPDQGESQGSEPPAKEVEPKDSAQYNFTDPDSRIMLDGNKAWVQAYNAQAAVDSAHQLIVAHDVTNNPSDKVNLKPMVKSVEANTGKKPAEISADAGYFSEANVSWLINEAKIAPYIPPDRQKHNERLTSPRGPITEGMSVADRMRRKLRTKRGRAKYGLRKVVVEPVFGQIKRVMGFTQFHLRGLAKVKAEWALVCLAYNLRRIFSLKPLRNAIA